MLPFPCQTPRHCPVFAHRPRPVVCSTPSPAFLPCRAARAPHSLSPPRSSQRLLCFVSLAPASLLLLALGSSWDLRLRFPLFFSDRSPVSEARAPVRPSRACPYVPCSPRGLFSSFSSHSLPRAQTTSLLTVSWTPLPTQRISSRRSASFSLSFADASPASQHVRWFRLVRRQVVPRSQNLPRTDRGRAAQGGAGPPRARGRAPQDSRALTVLTNRHELTCLEEPEQEIKHEERHIRKQRELQREVRQFLSLSDPRLTVFVDRPPASTIKLSVSSAASTVPP